MGFRGARSFRLKGREEDVRVANYPAEVTIVQRRIEVEFFYAPNFPDQARMEFCPRTGHRD
jgi:hypothetical protein